MPAPKIPVVLLCVTLLRFFAIAQSLTDELAIDVTGRSREFSFTNKQSAFYYGETHSENTTSWQGFNVSGLEVLDDYELRVHGEPLRRGSATVVSVYPDYLKRVYPNGIIEELRPVDSLALFAVILTSAQPIEVTIIPLFPDARSTDQFNVVLKDSMALVAHKTHRVWLAIHGPGFTPILEEHRRGRGFSPLMLSSGPTRHHVLYVGAADRPDDAEHLLRTFPATAQERFHQRRKRIERLLSETHVETSDRRFDKALAWAKISLDALIMNRGTKGIFAGLPWFNNYWGRDTFIALPGATLVTGRFHKTREILRSFAQFQQRDSTSTDYGRIPNIVTTTDTAYNTADGTPRFVVTAQDYVLRSGDSSFITDIYPVVVRSIEGTRKYHTDPSGYLTHGDAETWMDAVGPGGPWSPRGNRANDIQALWIMQLEAGAWFATQVGDAGSAHQWYDLARQVRRNFERDFITPDGLIDHLTTEGRKDPKIRPNQIFAAPQLRSEQRARVTKTVTTRLTYDHGVASLSQDDESFHPFHQYSPYYPKDAAYHNGIVWTWLQGALISELVHFDKEEFAFRLTRNSVHQILDRGAAGTQSELLDAVPRSGEQEPRLSGTFSQAWNLGEFIRNFYDDYLGIRVQRYDHTLVLRPRLPRELGNVRATINLNGRAAPIEINRRDSLYRIVIDGKNLKTGGEALIELPSGTNETVAVSFRIPPQAAVDLTARSTNISLLVNGRKTTPSVSVHKSENDSGVLNDLAFTEPHIRLGLKSLKGPEYPLIPLSIAKASNAQARLLSDVRDPEGDDVGNGGYVYPSNPNFLPGSLDITGFTLALDSANAYFRLTFLSLSDPGWHPEYGFQLTYVAIAIDEDGRRNSGQRYVRHNSLYALDERHAYEKLILVGGGIQLEDKHGKIVAAYIPSPDDVSNPLGNSESPTIDFAIPLSYLGTPSPQWTLTVLVGAQDDHGGAGLGEFRAVAHEAGEWHGGGKMRPEDPNVYDVLVAPVH